MDAVKPDARGTSQAAEPTDSPSSPVHGSKRWRGFNKKWILALVAASLVVHGVGFAWYRLRPTPEPLKQSSEFALGTFHFVANSAEGGAIRQAEFSLHIELLEPADCEGRQRLELRKFRVQQDVEELLRKAHSGDFEDPALGDLKRQLLVQINQSLGVRVAGDVLITGLTLHRTGLVAHPPVATTVETSSPRALSSE